MNIEIGTAVTAWNPGCDNKTIGKFVGMTVDGYFRVEWTRAGVGVWGNKTYVGTFKNVEVNA